MTAKRATNADILGALKTQGPYLSKIAEAVGMNYRSVQKRFQRNKALQVAFDLAREALIDKAESNVMKAVEAGDKKMSTFILRTLGKKRGYVMRDEVVDPTHPVQVVVTPDLNGVSDAELTKYLQGLAQAVAHLASPED